MILLIPYEIKEKLTPKSTDTLVYVMYLQWAYMVTLMVILNLSKEVVGDCGCIVLPLVAGCLPAVLLYRVVREWRNKSEMKGVNVEEKDENMKELLHEKKENKKKKEEEKKDIEKKVVKTDSKKGELQEKKEIKKEVADGKKDNKKEEVEYKKAIQKKWRRKKTTRKKRWKRKKKSIRT